MAKQISGESKLWAFIGYLGILCILPLLLKKDDKFAHYHAKQGLILLIAWVIVMVFGVIPILGWIIGPILMIGLLILWIMGVINSLTGNLKPLPLIGKYGENLSL